MSGYISDIDTPNTSLFTLGQFILEHLLEWVQSYIGSPYL